MGEAHNPPRALKIKESQTREGKSINRDPDRNNSEPFLGRRTTHFCAKLHFEGKIQ